MVVTQRRIVRFDVSRAVILPVDWFRTFKLKEKQKLVAVYGIIVLKILTKVLDKEFILKEVKHLID